MADIESLIRARAYAIWEDTGRPPGRDTEHWFQAAQEIARIVPKPGTVTRLRQADKRTPLKKMGRA